MGEFNDLLHRVQRLEDIEAIRRVKARYLNACDAQDPQRAKNCFADAEVTIDFGHLGVFHHRDQWAELFKSAGCHPHVLDMHHGGNAEIEFVNDTLAHAQWALDYRNINTRDRTVTFLSVRYDDEFTKLGGQWQITRCRAEFRTALHLNYANGVLKAMVAARSVAEPPLSAERP
jgi:hypothetical protein